MLSLLVTLLTLSTHLRGAQVQRSRPMFLTASANR
jgi:hypothetical protein